MKKILIVALAASLGGCATMQPKIDKVFHRHHRISVKPSAAATPPIVPAPVIAAPVLPEKPKSFFQRHHIKWMH